MNENNVDYLVNQVKFTGFGDSLEFKIKENIAKGLETFQLSYKPDFGKDRAEATLHFRKSEQGNYFFNKYDLAIAQENTEPIKQSFSVSSSKQVLMKDSEGAALKDTEGNDKKEWINNNFTLKEAFNMMDVNQKMEGRSVLKDFVNKEGEKHTFWSKLDFSSKDPYGNYETKNFKPYELEAKLAQFPIKEMVSEVDRKQLIDSLQKGNRQTVTMVSADGKEEKRGLEANPQFKTVNLYEGNQRIKHQAEKQGASVEQGQHEKEAQSSGKKNAVKSGGEEPDEGVPTEKEKKARKRKQGIS